MASITKTTTKAGDTRYVVRWRHEGRSIEEWLPTLSAARAVKTQKEGDALAGTAIDPRAGARTLNAYFADWLEARIVKGRLLAPSTKAGYRRIWRRAIEPDIGCRALRTVRPETVRTWHGKVTAERGTDQAAKSYRLLHAVLATAESDELVRVNPCRIRGGGQEYHDERPMVATTLVVELADAIEPRFRALVMLAGFGALRTGESFGLRRRDVDVMHATVVIRDAKTEAGKRTVALPRIVVDALEHHIATFTSAAFGGDSADALVFAGPNGGRPRRATLSEAWRAAVAATGAPLGLRPHDLRHFGATMTARTPGITTKELMARIGHSSPRAALIYQHATEERDRAVAAYLDGVLADVERPRRAPVVGLARGAGVGLATDDRLDGLPGEAS